VEMITTDYLLRNNQRTSEWVIVFRSR